VENTAERQERLLEKIISLIKEDNRIRGLWAVGSSATGKMDKYSDLDLYILVEKENYEQVYSERASFAEKIEKVLSTFEAEWPNCQLYGVILENCIEVDLCYCKPEQVEVFGPHRILYDRNGDLEELLSKHRVKFETDLKKRLVEQLDFAAYNLLHAANMLGRGEYWSSIRQLELLRKRIVSLIGLRTRTDVDEEYRRLESLVHREENDALQKTLCDYSLKSLKGAIQAATVLFVEEAKGFCRDQGLSFPAERYERLLAYLNEVYSEKKERGDLQN